MGTVRRELDCQWAKFSNLGTSIVGTLNIPVWNWGATQSRVKQGNCALASAAELSAQRKLLAEIQSLYAADTANELSGLKRSAELSAKAYGCDFATRMANQLSGVVDAQTTFSTANSAYQDGAVRYRVALANL
jgi:hypothetical protein